MKIKIVADSSADLLSIDGIDFESVPLTINSTENEYTDNSVLNVDGMVKDLSIYKGKSGTACPSVGGWLKSFEGYDEIYVVTITSKLSGSYNSAMVAKSTYLDDHPNAKIHVFDSYSTGPEMLLLIEKIRDLIHEGKEFLEVVDNALKYLNKTELYFCLESIHNLAQNGRVSKLSEVAARILNIKIIGKAQEGQLQLLNKTIGSKRAFLNLMERVLTTYKGGKVRISHVNNLSLANKIKEYLIELYKEIDIKIYKARGLVSFYAEEGGVLLAFETL